MPDFNLPLPDEYFINKAKIIGIAEDRMGTGNRDGDYDPNRKDGVVMKIAIAADDDEGQRYGAIMKAKGNLDGFENVSRVPSKNEECYIAHKKQPFYDEGKETAAYDISAIFDLDGNLLFHKSTDSLLRKLQESIPTKLKLNIDSI